MTWTSLRNWLAVLIVALVSLEGLDASEPSISVRQITFGPRHHFFGYIGHVQNIPWNASGRYIVAMETDFHDHMPKPDEAADVVLIDIAQGNKVIYVDKTRAWNFQQGTMFY